MPVTRRQLRESGAGSDGMTAAEALSRVRWGGECAPALSARLRAGVALLAPASSGGGTCRGFLRFGVCKYGAACRFAHGYEPLADTDLAAHARASAAADAEAVHVVRTAPLSAWRALEATLGASALLFLLLLPAEEEGTQHGQQTEPRLLWSVFARDKALWDAAVAPPAPRTEAGAAAAALLLPPPSPPSVALRATLDGLPPAAFALIAAGLPERALALLTRVSRSTRAEMDEPTVWLRRLQGLPLWCGGLARRLLGWTGAAPAPARATLAAPGAAAALAAPLSVDDGAAMRRAYWALARTADWGMALRFTQEVAALRALGALPAVAPAPLAAACAASPPLRSSPAGSGGGGGGSGARRVASPPVRAAHVSTASDDEASGCRLPAISPLRLRSSDEGSSSGSSSRSVSGSDGSTGGRRMGGSKGYRHPWSKSSSASNPRKKASKAAMRRAASAAAAAAAAAAAGGSSGGRAEARAAVSASPPPRRRASRGSVSDASGSDGGGRTRRSSTPASPPLLGRAAAAGSLALALAPPAPTSATASASPALLALHGLLDGLLAVSSATTGGKATASVGLPLPWHAAAVPALGLGVPMASPSVLDPAASDSVADLHHRASLARSALRMLATTGGARRGDGPAEAAAAALASAIGCGGGGGGNGGGAAAAPTRASVPWASSLALAARGLAFVDVRADEGDDAALPYTAVASAGASEAILRQPSRRGVGGLGIASALGVVRGGLTIDCAGAGLVQLRALAVSGGATLAALDTAGAVRVWAGDGMRLSAGRCAPASGDGGAAGVRACASAGCPGGGACSLAFSAADLLLVAGHGDGSVSLNRLGAGQAVRLAVHLRAPAASTAAAAAAAAATAAAAAAHTTVALAADGASLLVARAGEPGVPQQPLAVYATETGQLLRTLGTSASAADGAATTTTAHLCVRAAGAHLAISGDSDGVLRVWDARAPRRAAAALRLPPGDGDASAAICALAVVGGDAEAAALRGGQLQLAEARASPRVRVWDARMAGGSATSVHALVAAIDLGVAGGALRRIAGLHADAERLLIAHTHAITAEDVAEAAAAAAAHAAALEASAAAADEGGSSAAAAASPPPPPPPRPSLFRRLAACDVDRELVPEYAWPPGHGPHDDDALVWPQLRAHRRSSSISSNGRGGGGGGADDADEPPPLPPPRPATMAALSVWHPHTLGLAAWVPLASATCLGASAGHGAIAVGGAAGIVLWQTAQPARGEMEAAGGDRAGAAAAAATTLSRIERQRAAQAGKRMPDRKATQLRGQWGAGR